METANWDNIDFILHKQEAPGLELKDAHPNKTIISCCSELGEDRVRQLALAGALVGLDPLGLRPSSIPQHGRLRRGREVLSSGETKRMKKQNSHRVKLTGPQVERC